MTYKQVFVINSDLGMSKGKIPVQVAHGEQYYMSVIMNLVVMKERIKYSHHADFANQKLETFDKWKEGNLVKKIVLKAAEQEMDRLYKQLEDKEIWVCRVHDAGLTQVPEGSFTCLVTEPITDEQYDELFRHLKLL